MNEIGEILKKARVEKGYTLDDLQQTTKIQKRYLEAIEEGNTEILPGRFYARAFVKQYADIVGLDGEKLLEEHLAITSEEASAELAESVNIPSRIQKKQDGLFNNMGEQLPTILIFVLVSMILVVIYFAFRQTTPAEQTQTPIISEESTEEVVTSETDEKESTESETEEQEEEVEEEAEQEIKIGNSERDNTTYEVSGPHPEEQTITLSAAGGNSWVNIEIDGQTVESETLADATSISATFGADVQTINLRMGNAGATKITLNDTELQYGEETEGTVQNMTIDFID